MLTTIAMGSATAANAPGVTHVIENGEPVVVVRLVPAEEKVAPGPRINALETSAGGNQQPLDADAAQPPEERTTGEVSVPLDPQPAAEAAPDQAASNTPAVARYPSVRPKLKPNEEIGQGGALDLVTPPEEATPADPKPMRLNSIDRPRRVVNRDRQRERRSTRQNTDVAAESPAPKTPDPLDAAAEPIVLEAQPVDAIGLPLRKSAERVAGGN